MFGLAIPALLRMGSSLKDCLLTILDAEEASNEVDGGVGAIGSEAADEGVEVSKLSEGFGVVAIAIITSIDDFVVEDEEVVDDITPPLPMR
jgi:hypothetical protein